MNGHDLLLAVLLPLPPWLGFMIYRSRGKVGLSYGYFLGGLLAVLSLPWPQTGSQGLPSAHLGGALFGFTLFLQAHREGRRGLRNLAVGVGGATACAWALGIFLGLDMRSVLIFWATALVEAGLWLLLSDLGYRLTRGRWLSLRMPATGGLAFLAATALYRLLPLGIQPLSWAASALGGVLLGLVALQQLLWLRAHGIWVEGRGNGLKIALSALERDRPAEGPALAYVIEARQPMFLVNEKGMLLETNTAFSRLVGVPRHQMKGYQLQDLFQGRDAPAWDELKEQLLRDSWAGAQATLVRKDSSFQAVRLEAVAFDRNLALVWIAGTEPGTLALRQEGPDSVVHAEAPEGAQRLAVSTLGIILPAVEQILGETWNMRTREAAEKIMVAAQRLQPEAGNHIQAFAFDKLETRPGLADLLPRLQKMLPPGFTVAGRGEPFTLFLAAEPFRKIATQLLLHGRQALVSGTITLALTPATLGNRSWACLTLELDGVPAARETDFLGLSWLQQTVREVLGMLEMVSDAGGFLWPKVYLPCAAPDRDPAALALAGQRVWILDADAEVRQTLGALVGAAGGEARTFPDLRVLLRALRAGPAPHLLVLERSPRLERYHDRLQRLGGGPVPALILGDGRPLVQGEGARSRLILLEKPFPGQNFLQCLLALLRPS